LLYKADVEALFFRREAVAEQVARELAAWQM
jgi:hypothetical protein